MLARLIYCSKATCKQGDIEDIFLSAFANNIRDAITGILLFRDPYFVQVIEGDRIKLNATFLRIIHDKRHKEVCLLDFRSIEQRFVPDWSTYDVSDVPLQASDISSGGALFNPYQMPAPLVMGFLARMAARAKEAKAAG